MGGSDKIKFGGCHSKEFLISSESSWRTKRLTEMYFNQNRLNCLPFYKWHKQNIYICLGIQMDSFGLHLPVYEIYFNN